jgi:acetyltransferase-like isoleucine patch superfamily enzyme
MLGKMRIRSPVDSPPILGEDSSMSSPLQRLADSTPAQILITLVIYGVYATVLGLSLTPSVAFVYWTAGSLLGAPVGAEDILLFALGLGAAVYLYFIAGILVQGSIFRLLSLGVGPGRYPLASPTTLRWLIYSGIYTITSTTILPLIPVSFFSNLYFRIIGCRFGKRVYLNSYMLLDPYLIEIGDDVTIGGQTDVSAHSFEGNTLILDRIRIGSGSLIGAHCYISPGVTIGTGCVIGLGSFLRRGTTVPDGAVYTSLAALPVKRMAALEKNASRR